MQYSIVGGSLPAVVIQMRPGETIISEVGGRSRPGLLTDHDRGPSGTADDSLPSVQKTITHPHGGAFLRRHGIRRSRNETTDSPCIGPDSVAGPGSLRKQRVRWSGLAGQIRKKTTVSTDPVETEGPTEPEPESQPGSASGKQPSGISKNNEPSEPTEGAPDCEDYKRFEGIYKAPSEDWQAVVLEVSAYSDLLLLEYGAWEDGSLVYSWAEEFWPDPDIVEYGEFDNVSGYYQGFSVTYGTAEYWSAAAPRTIVLTDDGLVFQEEDVSYTYRRSDTLPTIHSSFADQKRILSGEPSAALAGEWGYNDPYSAGYLHMGSDGSFTFVWKDRHRPAEVWTGAWVTGSDTDQITVCAARIGDMEETYELQLGYFQEGSCRFLSYEGEEASTVLAGGIFLWPEDGQWSTGFSLERLSSVFFELLHVDGTVESGNGDQVYYLYRIAIFLDDFGSDALGQINSEIWERFWDPAQKELA